MNVCVIGTGFVGVVTAAVYASFGNQVVGLDIDPQKIEKLREGVVPFYEPGLKELLLEQQAGGKLKFTVDYQEAVSSAEVIIIAVGTPSSADGQVDLKFVHAASESLAPYLSQGAIVVVKSTVPPGTLPKLKEMISAKAGHSNFFMASVPEFLKEGTAVEDTLHPDRVVIGAIEESVFAKLEELHQPLNAPIVRLSPESAQMAKYAANAYLATRITFINQIADLCEQNGADINQVIEAIGFDKRVGAHYWYPGFGYGGSCFPKDVKELAAYSRSVGFEDNLLNHLNTLNEERIPMLMAKYEKAVGGWEGKKVAVLGLAFKPNTDDMREAPSLKVIPYLLEKGADVIGFDPKSVPVVPFFLKEHPHAKYTESIGEALLDVDVIMALIEWPEIIGYDLTTARVTSKPQWVIDARNQFDAEKLTAAGYQYIGVGR
ncbi:UDP-glucose/GDP-mannose dehydrogenase family protein [Patescibacteria group bacterium]|nr:UDP-glucose/GDP-mannose dehydrogenase family protein [Patescibacteria group bacterium]